MIAEVIYEDNHLLVINKPAGLLAQGDKTGDSSLVDFAKEYLKNKYQKPGNVFAGLVHRLDRPVSGVVVLARTSKALSRLSEQFKNRRIRKKYWALVSSALPDESGKLTHWLRKDTRKNRVNVTATKGRDAKEAVLDYELLSVRGKQHLVAVYPITGRPHQIRVQLSTIGCPIVGDLKYGHSKKLPDGSICLHARSITIEHPTKKEALTFEASIPTSDHWRSFADLT